MRRVKRLNPTNAAGQQELFDLWRHHAVFVTSGFEMLQAEGHHRDHAIIEQVIADAAGSALAHLPSDHFPANATWAVLWAIAHNPRPRRRRPGRGVSRPRHHRHPPRSSDQRPRPAGPLGPARDPAPA